MLKHKAIDIGRVVEAYSDELRRVEAHLDEMFSHENLLVKSVARHLLGSGGKRLRPMFLLLSARLSGYKGSDHIPLAGIVEIIHTASLLHDDVVDEADLRRGNPTANSLWGNATVVLVGDYLYSNALKYAVSFNNLKIIKALSSAITCMTDGELIQLEKTSDISITEEEYLRIASGKTGALFSEACRIGGILGGVSEEQEEAIASYGMNVGIAFQMMDDILDYGADEGELGKKLGKDLEEGKITLPLICLLGRGARKDIRAHKAV
jgi:octaprenyl-diphosphate synthase